MDVKNKRVVVTGAASGIGKALCEAFHQAAVLVKLYVKLFTKPKPKQLLL